MSGYLLTVLPADAHFSTTSATRRVHFVRSAKLHEKGNLSATLIANSVSLVLLVWLP